jgi:integrase
MKIPKITPKRRVAEGVFYVRYRFLGERLHYSLGTADAAEADKLVERIKHEFALGIHKPLKQMIFENLVKEYLAWTKLHNVASSFERNELSSRYALAYFHGQRIDRLCLRDGEEYQKLRLEGKILVPGVSKKKLYSKVSVNREARFLISMFNRAVAWDLLDKNPFEYLKLFRETLRERYVRTDEWPLLLSVCQSELRSIVIFARFTGMRLSEILACHWHDVAWDQNHIHVPKTKTNVPRIVPLNPFVKTMLEAQRKSAVSEYLFPCPFPDRESWVKHGFMDARDKAGIADLRFHDLRHTFASDMVSAGVSLGALMKLMGHKTITTTMRYAHLYPEHIQEAIEKGYQYFRGRTQEWDQKWDQNQS